MAFVLAMYGIANAAPGGPVEPAAVDHVHAFITNSLFLASDKPTCQEASYEWCSDSGTNRFVTNDNTDSIPGSIIEHDTLIAVGGGTITSQMMGTVLVKSNDHDHRVYCTNVLYIPQCAKKLMPASAFV